MRKGEGLRQNLRERGLKGREDLRLNRRERGRKGGFGKTEAYGERGMDFSLLMGE